MSNTNIETKARDAKSDSSQSSYSKWVVVCHPASSYEDEDAIWTVGPENELGPLDDVHWQTAGGELGYGMTRERAQFIAEVVNCELGSSICSAWVDTPCHYCGAEMEGKESHRYEDDNGGDESWLCQKCHNDYQNSENPH